MVRKNSVLIIKYIIGCVVRRRGLMSDRPGEIRGSSSPLQLSTSPVGFSSSRRQDGGPGRSHQANMLQQLDNKAMALLLFILGSEVVISTEVLREDNMLSQGTVMQ